LPLFRTGKTIVVFLTEGGQGVLRFKWTGLQGGF